MYTQRYSLYPQYCSYLFCVGSNKHYYYSHCNSTSNELYLCPCHDLQQPRGVHPAHEYNHQQCGDGGRVARVQKRIWDRQKSCPEAVVHQEEEAEKNIHRLTLIKLFIPPPAPRSKRHNFFRPSVRAVARCRGLPYLANFGAH